MKFRKKPVVIEAFKYDDAFINLSNEYVPKWAESAHTNGIIYFKEIGNTQVMMIKTLEGEVVASIGDYIIKGINGEIYPCKPDIFEKTYDPIDEKF